MDHTKEQATAWLPSVFHPLLSHLYEESRVQNLDFMYDGPNEILFDNTIEAERAFYTITTTRHIVTQCYHPNLVQVCFYFPNLKRLVEDHDNAVVALFLACVDLWNGFVQHPKAKDHTLTAAREELAFNLINSIVIEEILKDLARTLERDLESEIARVEKSHKALKEAASSLYEALMQALLSLTSKHGIPAVSDLGEEIDEDENEDG